MDARNRTEIYSTLHVGPAEEVSNEYFEAINVETFEILNVAEATLRRMEPVWEQGGIVCRGAGIGGEEGRVGVGEDR